MASTEKRLTREQIATSMAKACHDEPCYPVSNGAYGACAICPNRKVKNEDKVSQYTTY